MTLPDNVPVTQWATINQTEKFIAITPLSGYRRSLPEDELGIAYLEPDATETILGKTLLEVLNRSRFIHPHADRGFFAMDRILAADKRWHADFMKRFRYKTKRDAYKNMRYCHVKRCGGIISIKPHRRDAKPGLWWDLPPDRTVIVPQTNDPRIIGTAARLALSRCE
jgi:hypothetical protein